MNIHILSTEESDSSSFVTAWKTLLKTMPAYDIGQTHEWCRCWWNAYRDQGPWKKQWFVLAHENKDCIDGIAPLMIRERFGIRIVEFLGQSGGFMTDYSSLIVGPEERREFVNELIQFLLMHRAQWDVLSLRIPGWTDQLGDWLRAVESYGGTCHARHSVDVLSTYVTIHLPTRFDAYVASLGAKTKQHLRQYLRAAERSGASLEMFRDTEACGQLEVLYRLNQDNWTVFANAKSRQFMSDVMSALVTAGEPVLLGVFRAGGGPCGAFQAFESVGRFFLHTAGVKRRQVDKMSPGTTMYGQLISSLIERGYQHFNMGPGAEDYKLRLGGMAEPIYQLQMHHCDSRMLRWRTFSWGRNLWYGVRRHLVRSRKTHSRGIFSGSGTVSP